MNAHEHGRRWAGRHIPSSPPHLVRRERLHARLDRGRQHTATLVRGPAGTGKTTLVAAWAREVAGRGAVAWLSLTPAENDPATLWSQVVRALAAAGAGEEIGRLSTSPCPPDGELLPQLLVALEKATTPVVLVLDDLHTLHGRPVLRDLSLLLRSPPAGVHVVLIARSTPAVHLARLRLAGEATEIGDDELRFRRDESGELLRALGLRLPASTEDAICAVAEGWAAGLALAAISVQRPGTTGATPDALCGETTLIAEYLEHELLDELPLSSFEFLQSTSMLQAVCGDLADAMTGERDGAATLHDLGGRGMLVDAVEGDRQWYRYHGLLAGMLHARLRHEDPAHLRRLHRRAATWLSEHGLVEAALRHAVSASDPELGDGILARQAAATRWRGESMALAETASQFPAADVRRFAFLSLVVASAAAERGEEAAVRDWALSSAARADAVAAPLRDAFAAGRASLAFSLACATGDVPVAERSLGPIPDADALDGRDVARELEIVVRVGVLQAWIGDPVIAREHLDRGLALAGADDRVRLRALAGRAVAYGRIGDPDAATADATHALRIADAAGRGTTGDGLAALVALAMQRTRAGHRRAAAALLVDVPASHPVDATIPVRIALTLVRARIAILDGRTVDAAAYRAALNAEHQTSVFRAAVEATVDPVPVGATPSGAVVARDAAPRSEHVTAGELAVLRYLPSRMSNADIAADLHVSIHTVKSHVKHIYAKLDTNNRPDAVSRARRAGLVGD